MESAFRIEKSYLVGLATWLSQLQLDGRASRFRTRFVKDLTTEIKSLDDERISLAKAAAEKDEDGEAKMEGEGDEQRFVVPVDNQQKLSEDVIDLMKEELVIDVTESNKEKMQAVRDIVLDTDYKFGPAEGATELEKALKTREANDYDVWCAAFEGVDTN